MKGRSTVHAVEPEVASSAINADEPSWSPDGKEIVFVSTRDGFRELYIQGIHEKTARRLTFQRGQIHTPAWSPLQPPTK